MRLLANAHIEAQAWKGWTAEGLGLLLKDFLIFGDQMMSQLVGTDFFGQAFYKDILTTEYINKRIAKLQRNKKSKEASLFL